MNPRVFCTYFDHNYLSKGLALYHSLARHSPNLRLFVLCLSDRCLEVLRELALPGIETVSLEELEQADPDLLRVKNSRSVVEYYFTLTPCWPKLILERYPEIEWITYVDSDLLFFNSVEYAFAELRDASIAITPHRFSPHFREIPHLRDISKHGMFNVGWVGFRNDVVGKACVDWYRERCLEWCFDIVDRDRFADQKYLDRFPEIFNRVHAFDHPGVNLAPWNIARHSLSFDGGKIKVDSRPLVFYHYSGCQQVELGVWDSGLGDAFGRGTLQSHVRAVWEHIYLPYFKAVDGAENQLRPFELDVKHISRYG